MKLYYQCAIRRSSRNLNSPCCPILAPPLQAVVLPTVMPHAVLSLVHEKYRVIGIGVIQKLYRQKWADGLFIMVFLCHIAVVIRKWALLIYFVCEKSKYSKNLSTLNASLKALVSFT